MRPAMRPAIFSLAVLVSKAMVCLFVVDRFDVDDVAVHFDDAYTGAGVDVAAGGGDVDGLVVDEHSAAGS